jgi:hypothetical protein
MKVTPSASALQATRPAEPAESRPASGAPSSTRAGGAQALGEVRSSSVSAPVSLVVPGRPRAPVGEGLPASAARPASSQVAVRVEQSEARARGKRQKFLKTETVAALGPAEGAAFRALAQRLGPEAQALRGAASEALALGLSGLAEAVAAEAPALLREARRPRPEALARELTRAGLHLFLAERLVEGRLTLRSVGAEIERLRGELEARRIAPEEAKNAILAFDALAQRLAVAGSAGGEPLQFSYGPAHDRARDLLIAFARALHR